MRKWSACVLTLLCGGLCVSAIAQLNHIGGQLSIVDWPMRTLENTQMQMLEIEWSLETDVDSLVLSLKGRWLLGTAVEINGQENPVCDSGYVRATEPDGCSGDAALKLVMETAPKRSYAAFVVVTSSAASEPGGFNSPTDCWRNTMRSKPSHFVQV